MKPAKYLPLILPQLFVLAAFFISVHLWGWEGASMAMVVAFCILFVLALCFGWGY